MYDAAAALIHCHAHELELKEVGYTQIDSEQVLTWCMMHAGGPTGAQGMYDAALQEVFGTDHRETSLMPREFI